MHMCVYTSPATIYVYIYTYSGHKTFVRCMYFEDFSQSWLTYSFFNSVFWWIMSSFWWNPIYQFFNNSNFCILCKISLPTPDHKYILFFSRTVLFVCLQVHQFFLVYFHSAAEPIQWIFCFGCYIFLVQ